MAKLRVDIAKKTGLIPEYGHGDQWRFLWVTNPPLFEYDEDTGRWAAAHHAFTRPVAAHMFSNYDGVLKIDGEVGNKKAYDPSAWGKAAEAGMSARVVEACENLSATGHSIG